MSESSTETSAEPAGGTAPENQSPTAPGIGAEPTVEERLAAAEAERDKWQSLSRKNEDRAKVNAQKAKRFDELEAASKSDLDKANDRATQAEGRVSALTQRAVRAEVKALAAARFADPSDAAAFLNLGDYVDEEGDIDTKGIEKALADLLKSKPHLARADAGPSFDPGARTTAAKPTSMNDLIRQAAAGS
ncbi:hypothetical protein AB0B79_30280 [Streptomyces sp. NPDC039022]|uniref:hypothetical protein n=1 Tax=Streptomyces sp. NPDC039022 TaxID=3157091 RepID=UPI00340B7B58